MNGLKQHSVQRTEATKVSWEVFAVVLRKTVMIGDIHSVQRRKASKGIC